MTTITTAAAVDNIVNCTICQDGSAPPLAENRFQTGPNEVLTCQTLFDRGAVELPASTCTSLQTQGRNICFCNRQVPALNRNCTLCVGDNGRLPNPNLEGLPGKTCASVEVMAFRDEPANCPAYRNTVGVYCGCEDEEETTGDDGSTDDKVCRLCPFDQLLPIPMLIVNRASASSSRSSTGGGQSCVELELQANKDIGRCADFQDMYGDECCASLVPPSAAPTSGGTQRSGLGPMWSVVLFHAAVAFVCMLPLANIL